MMDTYTIYSDWFQHHYGREFNVTREQFAAWCRRPSRPSTNDFDVETELRDGWAYDHQFRGQA